MRSPTLFLVAFFFSTPLAAFADGYSCKNPSTGYSVEITTSSDGTPPKTVMAQGHATLSQGSQELANLTCGFIINAEDSDGDPRFYDCNEHVTVHGHSMTSSGYEVELSNDKTNPDGAVGELKQDSQSLGSLKCKRVIGNK